MTTTTISPTFQNQEPDPIHKLKHKASSKFQMKLKLFPLIVSQRLSKIPSRKFPKHEAVNIFVCSPIISNKQTIFILRDIFSPLFPCGLSMRNVRKFAVLS
jgi:hypothetical protein